VDYGWNWSREAAFSRTRARKMRPDVAVIHARCSRIASRAEVGYETKASQSTFEIERFAVNARPSRRNMLAVVQSVHSTRSSLEKGMLPPNQRRRTRPMPRSTRGQKNRTSGCWGSAWAPDAHSRPRLRLLSVQDKNRRGRGSYEVHASKSARDRGAERANYCLRGSVGDAGLKVRPQQAEQPLTMHEIHDYQHAPGGWFEMGCIAAATSEGGLSSVSARRRSPTRQQRLPQAKGRAIESQ
jgi:hypothetical protein